MNDTSEQLAYFIRRSPAFAPLLVWPQTIPPQRRPPYPAAEQIAFQLLEDSEFQALRLATWLRTPEGELLAAGVGQVIPPASRPEFELAVDALRIAAEMQYERGWPQRAAGLVALGIVAIFGLAVAAPAARQAV